MQNPFIQKLEHGCDLTDDDRVQLQRATAHPVLIAKGHTLIHEGDVPKNVHVILEGFACRYKQMDNGKRQITAYRLWHDGLGLSLYAKRLDRGRFIWPSSDGGSVAITPAQMGYLLEAIDWRNPQQTWRPTSAG